MEIGNIVCRWNTKKYMYKNSHSKQDILATFSNQFWRLLSGPLMLLVIPFYLTQVQQGYWYLFSSLAALRIFADLGFSNIILQFSAHEYAHLSFNLYGELTGDKYDIQKLGSFFRFVIKWLVIMCSVIFPIIFVTGVFFLVRDKVVSIYIVPWIIYSVGSLIDFFNNSIFSFIEGMDQIAKVQRSRLYVGIINTIVLIGCLLLHWNIYALSLAMLLSSSFMFVTIFYTFGEVIAKIWRYSQNFIYPWKREILPLFKKYVLSFASGYFIFQIYTPLIHYFHGPVYSGKVGISLSLVTAIFTFSNIWMYTITPRINMLVARKQWNTLDIMFHKRLFLGIVTYVSIVVMLVLLVRFFGSYAVITKIFERFLSIKSLTIIILSYFMQFFVNSWAVYLRGHKQEPYWFVSILSAIWVLVITLYAGKYLTPEYFFVGLLSGYLWGLPVCYIIYRYLKKAWHNG